MDQDGTHSRICDRTDEAIEDTEIRGRFSQVMTGMRETGPALICVRAVTKLWSPVFFVCAQSYFWE
jgi:hypothetical protein